MKTTIFKVLIVMLLVTSCSTFRETHLFKDTLQPVANYYKVEVKGYSFLSSSRYVSGYFDRTAIQEYFGEIGQPDKARFVPVSNSLNDQNKELVLLLSSNSDAIANGISNLVKNKTTINSIALMANKDKIEEAAIVKSNIDAVNNDIKLYKMRIDANLLSSNEGLKDAEVKKSYLDLVRSELAQLYPGENIPTTWNQIKTWLLTKQK